jgi:ABC-type lipoprotein release transport system permease subunit
MFPFLRYALLSVIRNKSRTLHAIVGIALALSMVTGSFIAVDSASDELLRSAVDQVSVDFVCHRSARTLDPHFILDVPETLFSIWSVQYVTDSTPAIVQFGLDVRNPAENLTYFSPYGGSQMVMIPGDAVGLFEYLNISGKVPAPGTVAISQNMADFLNLSVGNTLRCQAAELEGSIHPKSGVALQYYDRCEFDFVVSEIWTQDLPSVQNQFSSDPWDPADNIVIDDMLNPVVMNLNEAGVVLKRLANFDPREFPSELNYYVWIDRDEVITIADIPGSVERLDFIHNRLSPAVTPFGLGVKDSGLINPLQELDPQLSLLKGLAGILSLPVIALGVYLSLVGIDLGITGRRREVGILKSRGASNRQMFSFLMLESVIVGVIASAIGLLLGVIVSRFLTNFATPFGTTDSSGEVAVSWTDISISPWTVILSILLGIGLMLLSTYGPFKRVSKVSVTKALQHHSPRLTQTSYAPGLDIALIGLSIICVVSTILGTNAAFGHGFSWIVELLITILLFTGIFLFPIMPFFLSMSIIRLMTMGSHRLYAKLTFLVKPWTKELTYLVKRNMTRNPRRASNLGVIISLALAFGIFISVTMESTIAQEQESVKFEVGSDINVVGTHASDLLQVVEDGASAADALPGVERAAHYYVLSSTSRFGSGKVAAMNSLEYLDVVHPGDFYFIGHGSGVLGGLKENGTCLVVQKLADYYDLLEGDMITVSVEWPAENNFSAQYLHIPLQLEVIGFVKTLPGLAHCSIFIDSGTIGFASFGQIASSEATIGVFLETTPGADPNEVAKSAVVAFAKANINATALVFQNQLNALYRNSTFRTFSDFLFTQYALALIIMSVGVGLIIFVAVSDREHELACIMARGCSKSQIRRMLMGESISLMSLGLVVGTSVGVLTAYLFNTLWGNETAEFARSMVFTTASWLVLAVSIASLFIASLLATSRAGKVELAEVLRIRGG